MKTNITLKNTLLLKKEDIHKGPLVLVNREHPIGTTDPVKLVPADLRAPDVLLEVQCANMLTRLVEQLDATRRISYVSGHRSGEEQKSLYMSSLVENGEEFTRKYVAYPGCSEHQTGLAIDVGLRSDNIDFIRPSFPDTGIGRAFRRMAPQFGFVQRYEKGKEHLTGIAPEPWHFRYVGYPHSALMQRDGFCLEEYIDYLHQFPWLDRYLILHSGNMEIEICHIPVEQAVEGIELPEGGTFQVSGDNVDGFILTMWRG